MVKKEHAHPGFIGKESEEDVHGLHKLPNA